MHDSPRKSPPRYVPTLTQVVAKQSDEKSMPFGSVGEQRTPQVHAASISDEAQKVRQQLLIQTRQYIDVELQRRIRETVSQLALEHAYKMFDELQPQLESTISQVVDEAIKLAVARASTHAP